MRAFAWLPAVPLWLLSVATAGAQAPPASRLVESLLDLHGHAYAQARQALLDRQDVVEVARATLETTTYGPSTWLPLVLTEALAMHVTHRQEAERLQSLRGLDSDHYLSRRAPVPSAARELRGLRHVAPLMIELFLKGVETYAWSSPASAEVEKEALRRDLLVAIGRSDHAASVHFLTDVLEGGCACCESCGTVVAALGATGAVQALPVLLDVLDEARAAGDVARHTVVVEALGGIRHARTWPHIEAELDNAEASIREAAIRGAAAYGSRWYWRTDPIQGARIRAAIGSSLLEVLSEAEDEGVVAAVLESLSGVATPQLRDALEQRQTPPAYSVRSTDRRTARIVAGDRFRRALDRVNRTLARQQGGRDGARQCS